jgi:hypothetical protein
MLPRHCTWRPRPTSRRWLSACCCCCLPQIKRAGFKAPTVIQAQAWPIALAGRDIVAIAKTGSGKTCGFLLPGLMHIRATRKEPRCARAGGGARGGGAALERSCLSGGGRRHALLCVCSVGATHLSWSRGWA